MAGFDVARLKGDWHVLTVKEMVFDLPFADCGFGLDLGWMKRRQKDFAGLSVPVVLAIPNDSSLPMVLPDEAPHITFIEQCRGETFSDDPAVLHAGGNSGFAAINLAYLLKARLVVLFGFDYAKKDGLHHYENARYTGNNSHNYWPGWGRKFASALPQIERAGMTVLNASPESSVDVFEKITQDEGLALLRRGSA